MYFLIIYYLFSIFLAEITINIPPTIITPQIINKSGFNGAISVKISIKKTKTIF